MNLADQLRRGDGSADREELEALKAKLAEAHKALNTVQDWCELNNRQGSVIYKVVCDALKGGA